MRRLALFMALIACLLASPSVAAGPRIASINLCTDQLLMTLADGDQILGLSPYARDASSRDRELAKRFPSLSGGAEDMLMLEPEIILAGTYTKRATREWLKAKGLRVVEFDVAQTMTDVKTQIRTMGDVVGHPDRAAAMIARLDAAIVRARAVVAQRQYRVLALSRRGWVSGSNGLIASMLDTVGLRNASDELGITHGGFASLETIISTKPDLLLVANAGDFAEDEGRAFLLHPALERFYPSAKRIIISEDLTVCGGQGLADALDRLASEIERLHP